MSTGAFTVGAKGGLSAAPLSVSLCHGAQPLPQAILEASLAWRPGEARSRIEDLLAALAAEL